MSIPGFARENSYHRDPHAREFVHQRSPGAAPFSLRSAAKSIVRIAFSTSSPSIGGWAKKFRYLSSTGRTNSRAVCFYGTGSLFENVVPRLRDQGVVTGSEVQAAWDQMKAREVESIRKWLRTRIWPDRPEHPESLGKDFLIPREH